MVEFDGNGGDIVHRGDRPLNLRGDLGDDLGLGGGGGQNHGDAGVRDFDILDHAEGNDIAAEAGIFDFLEFFENYLRRGHWFQRLYGSV